MTLYSGRWIAHHGIPNQEVFTVAARGRRWVDQQWLAELVSYEGWRLGGYGAVGVLMATLIGSAYAALAALVLRRGASVVLTIVCAGTAFVMGLGGFFVHAELFALPLFALALWLCLTDAERDRPGRRMVLLVPLLVLWANLHGSVLLGAGLACAYLVYRGALLARHREWRVAGYCWGLAFVVGLTPLATPYGLQSVTYYRELILNPAVADAAPANGPPRLGDPYSLLFFVPLVLTVALLTRSALRRERQSGVLVAAVLATGVATFFAGRNTVWFGMTAMVLVADILKTWLPTEEPTRGFVGVVTAATAVLATVGVLLLVGRSEAQYETYTPLKAIAAAARYASKHPAALILGDNAASSALLWHDPSLAGRVGYDARLERYSEHSLYRWIAYQLGDGTAWRATTNGYQVLIGSETYNPSLVHRLALTSKAHVLAHDAKGIAVVNT